MTHSTVLQSLLIQTHASETARKWNLLINWQVFTQSLGDLAFISGGHSHSCKHSSLPDLQTSLLYIIPSIMTVIKQNTPEMNSWGTETERALTAIVFSLIPPTGRIFPVNDTSPVMATFCLTGQFMANDSKAVTIVHPALGPSFGVAPFKKKKQHNKYKKTLFLPHSKSSKTRQNLCSCCFYNGTNFRLVKIHYTKLFVKSSPMVFLNWPI